MRAASASERAREAVDDLARRLEREFPATNAGLGFRVTSLREMYSGQVRPYVLLLFGRRGAGPDRGVRQRGEPPAVARANRARS